jgi:hypothetical protein
MQRTCNHNATSSTHTRPASDSEPGVKDLEWEEQTVEPRNGSLLETLKGKK